MAPVARWTSPDRSSVGCFAVRREMAAGLDRMAGMCLLAISSGEPQLLGLQDLHLARRLSE